MGANSGLHRVRDKSKLHLTGGAGFGIFQLSLFMILQLCNLVFVNAIANANDGGFSAQLPFLIARFTVLELEFSVVLFPFGYVLLNGLNLHVHLGDTFFERLPWYLVSGWALHSFLLLGITSFALNAPIAYAMYLLAVSFSAIIFSRMDRSEEDERTTLASISREIYKRKISQRKDTIAFALFLISLLYFSFLIGREAWCPPGDSVTHSITVSLILYNNAYPISYMPVADVPFDLLSYPRGIHVSSSALCLLTQVYPGEATLILAGLASIIIPCLFANTAKRRTGSTRIQVLAFLLPFVLVGLYPHNELINQGSNPTANLLMANLANGTLANHVGNLMLISLTLFPVAVSEKPDWLVRHWKRWLYMILLGMITILTYYTYAVFVILQIGLWMTIASKDSWLELRRFSLSDDEKGAARICLRSILLIIAVSTVAIALMANVALHYIQDYFLSVDLISYYSLDYNIVLLSIDGILGVVAIILVMLVVYWHRELSLVIVYLSIFIPTCLSSINPLYEAYLWMIPTARIRPVLAVLTYFVLLVSLYSLKSQLFKHSFKNGLIIVPPKPSPILRGAEFLFLLFLIFGIASAHITIYQLARNPSHWGRPHGDDTEAIEYLLSISQPEDLVLNDRSWLGWQLPTFRAQNVVFMRWLVRRMFMQGFYNDTQFYIRAWTCWQFFNHPDNITMAETVFTDFGIQYVYISSDRSFLVYEPGKSYYASSQNVEDPRIFNQSWYMSQFDSYANPETPGRQFLRIIYPSSQLEANVRIYEVI
jgi:hypothetical protein